MRRTVCTFPPRDQTFQADSGAKSRAVYPGLVRLERLTYRGGFTLMEIVLAIALTAVVMYLLTTAIELYLVRVDDSRSRVESAQLARTILDRIAADLAAARVTASPGGSSGPGAATGGQPGSGLQSGGSSSSSMGGIAGASAGGGAQFGGGGAPGSTSTMASTAQGLFGTVEELRIDRAAYPNWQRATREVAPEETATVDDWPTTVRYYFVDGDQMTTQQMAQRGVSTEETLATATGLYREVIPTAALSGSGNADPLATPTQRDDVQVELLAPEVVKVELAYFDGQQFVETWDSDTDGGLPMGVEIRLTVYQPAPDRADNRDQVQTRLNAPRYREKELAEYRRFVLLPAFKPPQPADPLLPVQQAGGNANGGLNGEGGNNGSGNGGGESGGEGPDNGSEGGGRDGGN